MPRGGKVSQKSTFRYSPDTQTTHQRPTKGRIRTSFTIGILIRVDVVEDAPGATQFSRSFYLSQFTRAYLWLLQRVVVNPFSRALLLAVDHVYSSFIITEPLFQRVEQFEELLHILFCWFVRRIVGFPLGADIVKPRKKFCPNSLHKPLEFIAGEEAPDSIVTKSVRVPPLYSLIAHRLDKLLPFLLRQESELIKALCQSYLWSSVEKQPWLRNLIKQIKIILQIQ